MSVTANIHVKLDDRIQVRTSQHYTAVWIGDGVTLMAATMDGWTPERFADALEGIAIQVREAVQ